MKADQFLAVVANIRNDAIDEQAPKILRLLRDDAQRFLAEANPDGPWGHVLRYPPAPASSRSEGEP